MFFKIISFLYKLTYYFQPPHDIEIDEQGHRDFNLIGARGEKLYDVTKYFIWRKYSLFLIIPFLIANISLNIVSFFNIKNNIKKYQNNNQTYNYNNLGFTNPNLDMDFRNSTQEFINLLNSGKTLDYILFYNVFSSVCIFIEMLLIGIAIYKANIWYSSKKWIKYSAWFSYFWIYVVYLNPLLHYFKLEYDTNKSITNQTILYSYTSKYYTLDKNVLLNQEELNILKTKKNPEPKLIIPKSEDQNKKFEAYNYFDTNCNFEDNSGRFGKLNSCLNLKKREC